jgi:hypothetical protein
MIVVWDTDASLGIPAIFGLSPIAANSSFTHSAVVRYQHQPGYEPHNLTLQNGIPARRRSTVAVVA